MPKIASIYYDCLCFSTRSRSQATRLRDSSRLSYATTIDPSKDPTDRTTMFTCVYGFNRNSHYKETGNQGEYLPFIPPPRLLGGVGYDHGLSSTTFRSLAFRMEMDHYWAQNRYLGLFGTETATPAYTLFNVSAHTDLRYDKHRTMQLQLQVNNLRSISPGYPSRRKYWLLRYKAYLLPWLVGQIQPTIYPLPFSIDEKRDRGYARQEKIDRRA